MSPVTNVSARAYSWLSGQIRAFDATLWDTWWQLPDTIVNKGPEVLWTEPWPHDYWVAQGVRYSASGGPVQRWHHERALDEWPLLEATVRDPSLGEPRGQTNAPALDHILATSDPLAYEHRDALAIFLSYLRSAGPINRVRGQTVADPQLLSVEFVRAWLDSVLGPAAAGLVLSPTEDEELLQSETRRRLETLLLLHPRSETVQLDVAYRTEALYTTLWNREQPTKAPTNQGQAIWSRAHWFWLGRPLEAAPLRDSIHIAARLLVSPPILRALLAATKDTDEIAPLGLCVLRRWALGLRAMAWLEEAISHPWQDVRLADVVSFAYASIGPWWPRPSLAISHRSKDAKSQLTKLPAWGNANVAIDAMVIPNWESNTGFVWRLFAATPAIVRVRTESYGASNWCRREAELTQYLVDHSDFFRGRIVADADLSQLDATAHALVAPNTLSRPERLFSSLRNTSGFPPVTLVLDVPSQPDFIVNLLAAVCSLRLLHGLIGDVEMVNALAVRLFRGEQIDLQAPTNDPGGWKMHYEIFAFLAQHTKKENVPLLLAPDYPKQQRTIDIEDVVQRIPDLRSGEYRGLDLLAALEWNREVRRWFGERWGSNRAVVDCRGLNEHDWSTAITHSVKRGMLALWTETLVFIAQNAGQSVDLWPAISDRDSPILTQHVPGQLRWMAQALTLPTWIAAYVSLPDLQFHPDIVRAAFDALAGEFAANAGLPMPKKYADVFAFEANPDNPLVEALDIFDAKDTSGHL